MKSNNKHHRNNKHWTAIIVTLAILLTGGVVFGALKYQSLRNTVSNSYQATNLTKQRNTSDKLSKKEPISILLMGTDTGALGRNYKGRTDSMMVVTINPKKNKTTLTGIPRDTAVNIPGYKKQSPAKINAAYAFGQAETSMKTVQQMLNIPIDFYVLVNMGGIKKIVDTVGGIDVTPTLSFKYEGYKFKKGKKVHMDGKKALAYSRMRYDDPQNDYGRQKRQRQVLMAIIQKSGAAQVLINQDFISSVSSQVKTDLQFKDLFAIANDYRKATKVSETHLQGKSEQIDDQSMEVMPKKELQRVTNFIRSGLELKKAKTGNIAVKPSTKSDSKNSDNDDSTASEATTSYQSDTSSYDPSNDVAATDPNSGIATADPNAGAVGY
ncbi:LCP family protein [Lentilactobacillus senioris]|nr:LCP family protein [Lentilactobacillus senioris]MCY9806005.1 LCP family protein [Lentilactobacillus senioris]